MKLRDSPLMLIFLPNYN